MKITAVTIDQIIVIDGVVANLSNTGGFEMRGGEWAIQFDSNVGAGHVEYTDRRLTKDINQAEFDAKYAWLLIEHKNYIDLVAEQEALLIAQQEALASAEPAPVV
ncbi:hypothetical protein [Aliivibrio kagoshimensis]|uniref:hypothetical protein n=1 Tax=Aliivibrio kagoshimensis TaxID=2910230 RepID=UPI003D0DE81A